MWLVWKGVRRGCLLLAAVSAVLLTLLLSGADWTRLSVDTSLDRCAAVYRISSVLYDAEQETEGRCQVPSVPSPKLSACLASRRQRQDGRPTRVTIMGDSRMRLLAIRLAEDLTPVPDEPRETFSGPAKWDYVGPETSPETWCRLWPPWCSRSFRAGRDLRVDYFWQPYLAGPTRQRLADLLERCSCPHCPLCPHLVLLNGYMWYLQAERLKLVIQSGMIDAKQQWSTAVALLLRQHLHQAEGLLAGLAQRSRVVWRLDDGIVDDLQRYKRKGFKDSPGPALHAIAYEILSQVPGLTLWTSGLPEVSSVGRRLCHTLDLRYGEWTDEEIDLFVEECEDVAHGGPTARRRALDALLTDLCSGHTNLSVPSPCCAGPPAYSPPLTGR